MQASQSAESTKAAKPKVEKGTFLHARFDTLATMLEPLVITVMLKLAVILASRHRH